MGLRALKIDALSLAEELENAGIPRAQADAQIKTTIKVVDMAIEERLVTKHDLTQALHHTEEKLLTEISKLKDTDEKLFLKIIGVEEKLSDFKHEFEKNAISTNAKIELSISTLKVEIKDQLNKQLLLFGGMLVAAVGILGTLFKLFGAH